MHALTFIGESSSSSQLVPRMVVVFGDGGVRTGGSMKLPLRHQLMCDISIFYHTSKKRYLREFHTPESAPPFVARL